MANKYPKNHAGSSKSIETEEIFQTVQQVWSYQGYCIVAIISNDDLTMKSNLKHSFKEKIVQGLMKTIDWPKTAGG